MTDNLRFIVDLIAIVGVGFALIKGGLTLQETVKMHSKWIEDHEECNQKQIEILTEVREHVAFIKGQLKNIQ